MASEKIHLEKNECLSQFELGFFPGPHELKSAFIERVETCIQWSKQLEGQTLEIPEYRVHLEPIDRIPLDQLKEDAMIVKNLYGVCPDWVPAYTKNQQLPRLTGGMAVQFLDPKSQHIFTWFQLKKIFRNQKKWLIYSRSEIISHEMCHVCRFHLGSRRYEETIAYRTSTSSFRKKIGGALLTPKDNQLLLLSLACWVSVDLLLILNLDIGPWSWPLRLFFPIITILGLWRNFKIQSELKILESKLVDIFGPNASSVLFCLDDQQILDLYNSSTSEIMNWFNQQKSYQSEFFHSCFPHIYK